MYLSFCILLIKGIVYLYVVIFIVFVTIQERGKHMNIILEGSSYLRRLSMAYYLGRYYFIDDMNKQILKESILQNLPNILKGNLDSIDKKSIKVIERSNQSLDSDYFTNLITTLKDQPITNNFLINKFAFSAFADEILEEYRHKLKPNDLKAICKKIMDANIPIILFTSIPETKNKIDVKVGTTRMQYRMRQEYSGDYRPNYLTSGDLPVFSPSDNLSEELTKIYIENDVYNALGGTIESYFKVEKPSGDNEVKKKKEKERYKNLFIINIDSNKKIPVEDKSNISFYKESDNIDHVSIIDELFLQLDNITEKILQNIGTNDPINS